MADQNGGPRDPQSPLSKAKQDVKVSAGVQPLWQTAVGSDAAGREAGSIGSISDSTLAAIVEEAKLHWTDYLGVGDARLAVLNSVNVQVGNLPEDRLGVTLGHNIYLDSDAAGRGWQTTDLLSIVMHELGHVLGFDHDDAGAISVMNGTLDAGAHYQLGIAGNSAASLGLAGFFTDADIAQQVIDQQSSDASIVTPPAKSALTDGLRFSTTSIVVRAISLLDYTVGAADVTGARATRQVAANDNGAADEIHGEAGGGFDNLALAAGDPVDTALPKAALLVQDVADVPVGTVVDTIPEALVAAAKAMWLASGLLDAASPARLAQLAVTVADLDGRLFAVTSGTAVTINRDAAGHGWFVDPSPAESSEFAGSGAVLQARPDWPAAGRMDLLIVLLHGIGHVFGFDHDAAAPIPAMQEVLEAGTRALLATPGEAGILPSLPTQGLEGCGCAPRRLGRRAEQDRNPFNGARRVGRRARTPGALLPPVRGPRTPFRMERARRSRPRSSQVNRESFRYYREAASSCSGTERHRAANSGPI
jgi:predicted Zn-dependent protease with MMP-like domain